MERTSFILELIGRMKEPRKFIQVVAGPRQVGKTTIIMQFLEKTKYDYISDSADAVSENVFEWLERLWTAARLKLKNGSKEVLLVIDEVQKLSNWSEVVKKFWDEDTRKKQNIKVILSGSSRLLLKQGLTESLQGRFELIYVPHWSFSEMKKAFGFTLDEYIYFGGYPGAANLIKNEKRWKNYLLDSIIETSISKDILMLTTITKPALLRQLFDLGTAYSAHIMSFTKMLGTLTDAGNTVTLAHYLNLLEQCGLLGGLQKYSGSKQRARSSSPKLQVYNNALLTVMQNSTFKAVRAAPDTWGHFVESCVGAHLVNNATTQHYKVHYWRDGNNEVDFVVTDGKKLFALEVKSGAKATNHGMEAFKQQYPNAKLYVVASKEFESGSRIPLEQFLKLSPSELF